MTWQPRLSSTDVAALVRALVEADVAAGEAVVVHDLETLARSLHALREAFPPRTMHAVAIKANPVVGLLRALVNEGAALEAASIEEVHLALAAGCAPADIVYDSPAKTDAELRFALELGVRINADSVEELDRIGAIGRPERSIVGLRVNPQVGLGSIAQTSVAGPGSRFGVRADAATVGALVARHPFVTALHVHVGSQGCPLEMLVAGAAAVATIATLVPAIRVVDIGGGLPAHYDTARTPPPGPAQYVAALRAAAPKLFDGTVELVTEFGRALHAGAAFAVTPIEYRKVVGETLYAVGHLGADMFLRPAYRPDAWRHELLLFDARGRLREGARRAVTVAGPLCFAGDVIGLADLPVPEPGDLLVVRDVGAYTMGMWSHHCSRARPAVIGHQGGHFVTLKARESVADVVRFWS